MNSRPFLLLVCGFAALEAGIASEPDKGLQGSWKIVAATVEGRKDNIDPDRPPLKITGDRLDGLFFHQGMPAEVKIRVDSTKSPRFIDLEVGKPKLADGVKKVEGIYELKGDSLRLALGIEEKQKRPNSFATSILLKKVKE